MKVDAEDTEARVLKAAGTDQLIDWLIDWLINWLIIRRKKITPVLNSMNSIITYDWTDNWFCKLNVKNVLHILTLGVVDAGAVTAPVIEAKTTLSLVPPRDEDAGRADMIYRLSKFEFTSSVQYP